MARSRAARLDAAALREALERGRALHRAGQWSEAEAIYRQILSLRAAHVDALRSLALLQHQTGRSAEALALYERLRVMQPREAAILIDRGNVLKQVGRTDEALASYDKALTMAPGDAAALYNRGNLLLALDRPAEALDSFRGALARSPDLFAAHNNAGIALRRLGRFAEALACFEAALRLQPEDPEVQINRGDALHNLGHDREAVAVFTAVLRSRPDEPKAHFNAALALLRMGDLRRGFREYEWRWQCPTFLPQRRDFTAPLWQGGDEIAGNTILLHAEQGFGDTLQMLRYVPLVAARAARVLLEVPQELVPLMQAQAGAAVVIPRGSALPAFDLHCPLMSLPHAFGTVLDTVPASVPYLHAPDGARARWQTALADLARPRVGLVWAGRATHPNDAARSLDLAALRPLLQAGATFISLQKPLRPADQALIAQMPALRRLGDDLEDFADTAAVLSQLDLLITVDTAVAHLAGALGRPVWVLVPQAADWRWLTERDDTPWYPTMRLFRQDTPGDWDAVITRVAAAVKQTLEAR